MEKLHFQYLHNLLKDQVAGPCPGMHILLLQILRRRLRLDELLSVFHKQGFQECG